MRVTPAAAAYNLFGDKAVRRTSVTVTIPALKKWECNAPGTGDPDPS